MSLLDSHCHLDRFFRDGVMNELLARARSAGVDRFVAIGTEPEDWVIYRQLAADHSGIIAYAVGLHPNEVREDWQKTVDGLQEYISAEHAPVAVGEIGLDYFRLPKDETKAASQKALQQAAFACQLQIAKEAGVPVVIHCRTSFDDCLRMIDESGFDWSKVVFHCFSEGPEEIMRLRERGGRASFTGIITYGNAGKVREAALAQGMDVLMLETDCPYLSPEPHRGKPNEPAYLRHTASFCADLFETDLETLTCRTTSNAESFYGLNHGS